MWVRFFVGGVGSASAHGSPPGGLALGAGIKIIPVTACARTALSLRVRAVGALNESSFDHERRHEAVSSKTSKFGGFSGITPDPASRIPTITPETFFRIFQGPLLYTGGLKSLRHGLVTTAAMAVAMLPLTGPTDPNP